MAEKTAKPRGVKEIRSSVMLGLAGRVFPLTIEFDVRAMAEEIKKRFGVFLTDKEIEDALLDILWRILKKNPNITDRKMMPKSLGRVAFVLSFCPVPTQELSEEDFQKLIKAVANFPVET